MDREKMLRVWCWGIVAGVLIATLWPFAFFPRNHVTWLAQGGGVEIARNGVLIADGPLPAAGAGALKSCSVEIVARTSVVAAMRTILTFYSPRNPGQFVIQQWKDGLVVTHTFVDARNRDQKTRAEVGGVFETGKPTAVTITSGAHGSVIYTNGRAKAFPNFKLSSDDVAGQMVLGFSAVDYEGWAGEIDGLAVYSRELAPEEVVQHTKAWLEDRGGPEPARLDGALAEYRFDEGGGREARSAVAPAPALQIPTRFVIPHKGFLKTPAQEFERSSAYVNDVLRNIAGFMPAGFLFGAYLQRRRAWLRAVLYATVLGGLLSLTIEVLQFFVPQRGSGITDIITNTSGAFLGALLARPEIVQRIFTRAKTAESL